MNTPIASLICTSLLACSESLLAQGGFQSFEQSVYCDQNVNALVEKIRKNMGSGMVPSDDTTAALVANDQREVYQGILQQTASRQATSPNVFEFDFKNLSEKSLKSLQFRPWGGHWSGNAISDSVAAEYLNDLNLSLEFRGTSDSGGKPELKSVRAMVHDMRGRTESRHIQYVAIPTGKSSCDGVKIHIVFADDTERLYDINRSKASFRVYRNSLDIYDGMDQHGNLVYSTVRPE